MHPTIEDYYAGHAMYDSEKDQYLEMDDRNIVIWTDGAIEPCNPGGHAVGGWVIKSSGMDTMTGTHDCGHSPEMTNNIAEYCAIEGALTHLLDNRGIHDYGKVIWLRSDSKLAVEQLNDRWKCNNVVLREYRDRIWKLCEKFSKDVHFEWIPREQNKEADTVSRSLYGRNSD